MIKVFLFLFGSFIFSDVLDETKILSGLILSETNDKISLIQNQFKKPIFIELKNQTSSNNLDEFVLEKSKSLNGILIYISKKEKRILVLDSSKENILKDSDLYLIKSNLIKRFAEKKFEEGIFSSVLEIESVLVKMENLKKEEENKNKSILAENFPKMGIIFFAILGIFILLKLIISIFFSKKEIFLTETTNEDKEILTSKKDSYILSEKNKLFLNSESNLIKNKETVEKEFDSENDNEFKKRESNET